jgi:hypothetical protein
MSGGAGNADPKKWDLYVRTWHMISEDKIMTPELVLVYKQVLKDITSDLRAV